MTGKPLRCRNPKCQRVNDAATGVTGAPAPGAGMVSICAYCGRIGVFTGDGFETREPTQDEWQTIAGQPQVAMTVQTVLEARRRRAGAN